MGGVFGQCMGSVSIGVSVGVQYLGEGLTGVGVKGVRDAKESKSVSCKVGCKMVSSFRLQDVASMEWWPTRHVVLHESLSGGVFLYTRL